jgi:hypothetical protein
VKAFSKTISILSVALIVSACTYSVKLKDSPASAIGGPANAPAVSLIADKSDISNPTILIGAFKLNYDVQDSFLKGAEAALRSGFSKVDVASSPSPANPYYAVPHLDIRQTYRSQFSSGLELTAKIDIHETASRRLIQSYEKHAPVDFNTPGSVTAMGFLTGFLLFVPAPITIPSALNTCGELGYQLVDSALKTALTGIGKEIAMGPKTAVAPVGQSGGTFEGNLVTAKKQCSELGFKEGTKQFGDCVLKLVE